MQNGLLKKGLIFSILLLFFGTNIVLGINADAEIFD